VASAGYFSVLARIYGPNMDGHVFPDQPMNLITQGRYLPMPAIIGNTTEETLIWADTAGQVTDEATYGAAIDKVFGATARRHILAQYPSSAYLSPRRAFAQVTTDASLARAAVSPGPFLKRRNSQSIAIYSTKCWTTIRG
jgi:para-nitrobenzyl esterase